MDDMKKYSFISTAILCLFMVQATQANSDNVEFETRALELSDNTSINLSNFSRSDFIPEGIYPLSLKLNGRVIANESFNVINVDGNSQICFPLQVIDTFDLKATILTQLKKRISLSQADCVLIAGYQGITTHIEREKSTLLVSIPQALLNYSDPNWVPPSQWDEGISGILFDYMLSGNIFNSRNGSSNSSISSYGTAGANYKSWRLRSNYQTSLYSSGYGENKRDFKTTTIYATRALKELGAHLTIGKNYLQSYVFDSLNYSGISIASDDRMLPPALRGYAPRLTGVAKTNAKIIISRGGSIVYEKMVPPGPFVIEDLTDATSGQLTMTIREENGEEQVSTIETSNVPFLTRSGHVRYKAMLGRLNQDNGSFEPMVATMEASLGVFSNTSVFGGVILTDKNYHAVNGGVGYDMRSFGALSVDITHSRAELNNQTLNGESYRFNYSKVFDSIDSQITFAGYRFSEKTYLSLDNFTAMKATPDFASTNKESYNLVASKHFRDLGISINAMYNRQTYWQDVSDSNTYGLSVSKNFDIGRLKDINAYLTVNRTEYKTNFLSQKKKSDNSIYLSFNIPLSSQAYISSGMQLINGNVSPNMTYTNTENPRNIWSIGANTISPNYSNSNMNANVALNRDAYTASLNTSINKNDYYLGGSIRSGLTATEHGIAIHSEGYAGNTRLIVDTNGIEGVYVGNIGQSMPTNSRGITVLNNVPDYYRTNYTIDTNRLPDDVESFNPNIQMVLTEGAIGYRKLDLYRGVKVLIKLSDPQGKYIPFGTLIEDRKQKRQVGVVGENGEVYISGVDESAQLVALDVEGRPCLFTLPHQDFSLSSIIPLTCQRVASSTGKL
ncbi:fimbria/pilus outer membrane usher protein [Providencia vermicola]|uniref:fimbria/pilus outer membrane usher protein n=1 Tax=Providencia vermicola TaxID=333965 RepID=UPI002AB4A06C|nr:fimbrial biogenesis outer membrane usher protein [Providencia stuartii]